ncbi:hypothetical protein PoB_001449500 [Plakobranchus ocellatus]|uniref:Uncharacterized protein n=1 Tax=Plakobranchus ocellatus TaxID=259542 RepID=A0AAV3YYL4_9GAST|nr:hypothetical protein PoB_001449500 [Plakobranchus ocellatus]
MRWHPDKQTGRQTERQTSKNEKDKRSTDKKAANQTGRQTIGQETWEEREQTNTSLTLAPHQTPLVDSEDSAGNGRLYFPAP